MRSALRCVRRPLSVGLLALLATLVLAACGGGDTVDQRLTLNIRSDPPTLDPALGTTSEAVSVQRQLFVGLLRFDERLHLAPGVAAAVPSVADGSISPDGLRYTFTLRADARWSDGQPLTAGDFVYSIRRALDPALGSEYAHFFYDIAGAAAYNTALSGDSPASGATLATLREAIGVHAIDARTLEVSLANPRYTFLDVMALPIAFPVREDVITAYGDAWTDPGHLVGNGPFRLTEWTHDSQIILAGVDDWWGGEVRLDSLVFRMIPDDNAAYAAYLAGDLDVVDVPPSMLATLAGGGSGRASLLSQPDLSTLAYVFNTRTGLFADASVRRAFTQALDRETFVASVLGGVGVAAQGWLPPGSPGADLPDGVGAAFDPAAAQALLAQAGYPNGQGVPAVRLIYANVGPNALRAEFAQAQFRDHLGVKVDLVPLDPQAMGPAVFGGDFDLALFGWTADYPDPDNWLPELFRSDGAFNISGYRSPEFDALAVAAAAELDPVRRLDLWAQAHARMVTDAPFLFLTHSERVRLVRPGLADLVVTPIDGQAAGDGFLSRTYWEDAHYVAAR